ncbi:hypothetical protein NDU88_001273 [Pleurodeles waltl]|uniref:Uncharacterized protein n=1 Tax=Pleurodeles waltl TaxID=8319 RepID=A0AAV7MKI6_PLEWA|nr:hypothetical protein NDU88_001273 [Pleurodeles waltl]
MLQSLSCEPPQLRRPRWARPGPPLVSRGGAALQQATCPMKARPAEAPEDSQKAGSTPAVILNCRSSAGVDPEPAILTTARHHAASVSPVSNCRLQ